MSKKIKELQCLMCWADFYAQNHRTLDYQKTQNQITEFKIKNNLNEK